MINLLRAEWLKLSRRPLALILLGIFLAQLALVLTLYFALALIVGGGDASPVSVAGIRPEQLAQYQAQLRFPGVWGSVLGQINGIGGICAIILTAGALGSEYNWGTLRAQLARDPGRGRFLAAKLGAVLLLLLLAALLALALGSLLAFVYGGLLGDRGAVTAADALMLPVALGRSLLVLLPYVLLTASLCTLGRSVLAGMAGGLIFLFLDSAVGALSFLKAGGGPLMVVYNLLLQQNINTLVVLNARAFGLDPAVSVPFLDLRLLPPAPQALGLVLLYSASFAYAAYYWLARRDLTGAA
jgi:ABC-2 type transport system permease protein